MNVIDFYKSRLRLLSSKCLKHVLFGIAFNVPIMQQQVLDNVI